MHILFAIVFLVLEWPPLAFAQYSVSEEAQPKYVMKKGICLWSHGRSGSGTIAQTIKNSIEVDFCKHVKEGFRFQYPRLKFLKRCLQTKRATKNRSPPLRLTHVKPRHVTHSTRQPAASFSAKVQLVRDFMFNLKESGFGAVIVHRRHNTLAMLISDFELKYKRKEVLYRAFEEAFTDVVSILQYNYVILEVGFHEALRLNMSVIETNFTAVTGDDSCQEYEKIFSKLNKLDFGIPSRLVNSCVKVNSHVSSKKPRRNSSLEVRVGRVTSARITDALRGTPYEWMLDLSAKEWPTVEMGAEARWSRPAAATTNPCHDIRQCMPEKDADMTVTVSA